jgi:hypothetical protein
MTITNPQQSESTATQPNKAAAITSKSNVPAPATAVLGVAIHKDLDDLYCQIADAGRSDDTQKLIDELNNAMWTAKRLHESIGNAIKSAEAVKVTEENEKLEAFAKQIGYQGWQALLASRSSAPTLPQVAQPNESKQNVKRDSYPKAQKVYEYLYKPDHADFTKGFTSSLRNLTGDWVKKTPDGKADMSYYRKSTDEEKAEMQRRRDEYVKAMDAKREARAAKKP